MNELVEKLAALAHEQWSGWMKYLFSKTGHYKIHTAQKDNMDEIIYATYADALKRQMNTPYAELSEQEKDSDRVEAKRVIEALGLRPEVLLFAIAMERKLRANDHSGRWRETSTNILSDLLHCGIHELDVALESGEDILGEAADVANFAMMIADVRGALK